MVQLHLFVVKLFAAMRAAVMLPFIEFLFILDQVIFEKTLVFQISSFALFHSDV
jgi:hypothetical protein